VDRRPAISSRGAPIRCGAFDHGSGVLAQRLQIREPAEPYTRAFHVMAAVFSLAFPFFGLILLGFACGRIVKIPEEGMRWMNFFIVFVALPPLFFKLVSATPFEQLTNARFIIATTLCTFIAFVASYGIGLLATPGKMKEATIQGIFGAYSNVGYMGPGLTLAALGPGAAVPTALIFVFDSMLLFALLPVMMALAAGERVRILETALQVAARIASHPFNIATAAGVAAGPAAHPDCEGRGDV
jgi:predicted permease